jgi:Domain of unknown function DUF11
MKTTTTRRRKVLTGLLATATATTTMIFGSGRIANAQAAAVYTLTKTPVASAVTPTFAGATVSWTLKYKCASATVACGPAVLKDTLPPGVTYSSSDGGGVFNGSTVDWTFPNLVAGDTGILTVIGTVGCSTSGSTICQQSIDHRRSAFGIGELADNGQPCLHLCRSTARPVFQIGTVGTYAWRTPAIQLLVARPRCCIRG